MQKERTFGYTLQKDGEILFHSDAESALRFHTLEEASAFLQENEGSFRKEAEPECSREYKIIRYFAWIAVGIGILMICAAAVLMILLNWGFVAFALIGLMSLVPGIIGLHICKKKEYLADRIIRSGRLYCAKSAGWKESGFDPKISYMFMAGGEQKKHRCSVTEKRQRYLFNLKNKFYIVVAYDAELDNSIPVRLIRKEKDSAVCL